jgi:hypothetical protein
MPRRQHVQGGVLEGVIAAGFEDEGKVENLHGGIIPCDLWRQRSLRGNSTQILMGT